MKVAQVLAEAAKTPFATRVVKTKGGGKVRVNMRLDGSLSNGLYGIVLELIDLEDNSVIISKQVTKGFNHFVWDRPTFSISYAKEKTDALKGKFDDTILPYFTNQHFADLKKCFTQAIREIEESEQLAIERAQNTIATILTVRVVSPTQLPWKFERAFQTLNRLHVLSKPEMKMFFDGHKDTIVKFILLAIKGGQHEFLENTIEDLNKVVDWPEMKSIMKSIKAGIKGK